MALSRWSMVVVYLLCVSQGWAQGGGSKGAAGDPPQRKFQTCCRGECIDWSKLPGSIRPMPRAGNFPVPPTGPGYYSLLDQRHGCCRKKPPQSPYGSFALMPSSFFDADFRFVDAIDPSERTLVERLKRIPLNDCWMMSTGGQVWTRFMSEHNSRLTETDNSYLLLRNRVFGDLCYENLARVYGEYLWADSSSEELPPAVIDVNRGDILNLFVDVNLLEIEKRPVYVRVGRQELLLGSQRLVSTLDWANTRRTFDGVRLFRTGEKYDFDLFFAQNVPPLASDFDRADEDQDFAGTWFTYRPKKGTFLDAYYLFLNNSNTVVQQGIVRAPTDVHTLGTRWAGDREGFLWDFETMLQLGEQETADLVAGAVSAGLGRNWKDRCWNPTAWIYYDYASGDSEPNAGRFHTFNQLYPFGHFYLGWLDLVGRQNIHDANAHLIFYPTNWMTTMLQYHRFWLAERQDALYNAGGVAIRRDPTGLAGRDVGHEIDIILNFHVARYSNVLVGYSKLFGGSFLERTANANQADDAELGYAMFEQKW